MKTQFYLPETGIQTVNPLDMCRPIDLHKELKAKNFTANSKGIHVANQIEAELPSGEVLDITTWLGQAAPHYHISPNIEDYVVVPVVTIPAELPNRNGVGFPLSTLTEFIPEAGCLSYKTFKGKPTFYEHQNKDITKAKGVIADSHLRRMQGYGGGKLFKLVKLLTFDRNKDSVLVDRILRREINTYSMGAYLSGCECSYCGRQVGQCTHVDSNKPVTFYELNGHLVHKIMTGVLGFETSAVESPAWMTAISDHIVTRPS